MNCTTCQSDNTQRLQVVFESGTHNISMSSQSIGPATEGGPTIINTTSSGTSTSQLAQKCSPPAKASLFTAVSIGIVAIFMWMFSNSFSNSGGVKIFALGAMGLAIFLFKRARTYNTLQWPPLYEKWTRSWHCNRCGIIYTI